MDAQAPDTIEGRAPWTTYVMWVALLAVVIAGGWFLHKQTSITWLQTTIFAVCGAISVFALHALTDALRLRVIVENDTVLIRRAWTGTGFLLSEVRKVERLQPDWRITLEDGGIAHVPTDITNHARIGVALLEAEARNRARA
ncbi:MAG: hypothetical protein ACK5P8_00590 [Phycisphaerae bacterium]